MHPTCQTFTTCWVHIGHQNPPTTALCTHTQHNVHACVHTWMLHEFYRKKFKLSNFPNFFLYKYCQFDRMFPKSSPTYIQSPSFMHIRMCTLHRPVCETHSSLYDFFEPQHPCHTVTCHFDKGLAKFYQILPQASAHPYHILY